MGADSAINITQRNRVESALFLFGPRHPCRPRHCPPFSTQSECTLSGRKHCFLWFLIGFYYASQKLAVWYIYDYYVGVFLALFARAAVNRDMPRHATPKLSTRLKVARFIYSVCEKCLSEWIIESKYYSYNVICELSNTLFLLGLKLETLLNIIKQKHHIVIKSLIIFTVLDVYN